MPTDPTKIHDLIFGSNFAWPENSSEAASLARDIFITQCVSTAQYWIDFGTDLVDNTGPKKPFVRSWSDAAKKDKAYRDVLSTLTPEQKAKVRELLQDCVRGSVFSTLCVLDQFPHGEAEVHVTDGTCGSGSRTFTITRNAEEFHDAFTSACHISDGHRPPLH